MNLWSVGTVEANLAVRSDFRRRDHRVEDIFELVVEVLNDRTGQDAVKPKTAKQQKCRDPEGRDDDHAPRQRADARDLAPRRRYGLPIRRRCRGGLIVQARLSSGSSSV
jgi:hypothetical protein